MPDATFDDPRLAALYDPLDPDRSDLDAYAALAEELGAHSVLDIGCGTGIFAIMLAARGHDVVGVDPAGASVDVARAKPGADDVRWVVGEVADALPLQVDLVTMTANVAQVFTTEARLARGAARDARRRFAPGATLVLETRDPERRAWEGWTRELTDHVTQVDGVGSVRGWHEAVAVDDGPDGLLVTFDSMTVLPDGTEAGVVVHAAVRDQGAGARSRSRPAGSSLLEVRDAPDRPGAEMVFLARRPG